MNEIALSNDLNQIEFEINYHKQVAGQSVWEIGRRLNHVKENDLAHGEFINWLENKLQINRNTANRFMKVANELSSNDAALNHLGSTALYLIATLPEEEREKEHTLNSGETKNVDEMTTRELEEVKRKNKELEQQAEQAQRSEQIAVQQLEEEQNKEPEIVKKEVVKEPEDYQLLKSRINSAEEHMNKLREENQRLIDEQKETDEKSEKYDQLNEEINKMNGRLSKGQDRLKAQKEVYDLVRQSKKLIREVSPLAYLVNKKEIANNEYARKPIVEVIESLEEMSQQLRKTISEEQIIEGEIIND